VQQQETFAGRDVGRRGFSMTTMFTSLSPCDTCAALIYQLQFMRLVVGDITTYGGIEEKLRQKGVKVEILEDPEGVLFYAKFAKERPDLDREDAGGLASVRKVATAKS
jgi:cytosine/creatinine deaminase